MLWAAWADALGFISELTDERGLRRRLQSEPLTMPVQWTRRVGGKFGVDMTIPAGCYSDDTQLRLATARAVHGRGFDVEAFARIELAVWPAYALGGGRASKTAAAQMAKPGTPWFANFHKDFLSAGGNGVAMRIQPHVWAAQFPALLGQHILDIVVNGVTSHGHPRALVGAVLHGLSLGVALQDGQVPPPERWQELLDLTEQAVKLVDDHPDLAGLWRPVWESQADSSLAQAWRQTVDECRQALMPAAEAVSEIGSPDGSLADGAVSAYERLVAALDLRNPGRRGSAIATVAAALALAAAAPADPAGAARLAARSLGTDTDTIATMAAALIGATDGAPEPEPVLDTGYLRREALRLAEIAGGRPTARFTYPDLLHWIPPRTQLDTVGLAASIPALAGLGQLEIVENTETGETRDARWGWMRSDFGATFLVKFRPVLRALPEWQWPARQQGPIDTPDRHASPETTQDQLPLHEDVPMNTPPAVPSAARDETRIPGGGVTSKTASSGLNQGPVVVDEMLRWVARRGYTDEDIGYAMRRISAVGTLEQLIAFAAALRSPLHRG